MPLRFRLPGSGFPQMVSKDCLLRSVHRGAFLGIHHRYISTLVVNNFRFIFSRYSHCVSCGSGAVDRGGRLYFPSKNPLGWIQLLAAAPLRECSPCGRQFFDWRPARPLRSNTAFTAPKYCPRSRRFESGDSAVLLPKTPTERPGIRVRAPSCHQRAVRA